MPKAFLWNLFQTSAKQGLADSPPRRAQKGLRPLVENKRCSVNGAPLFHQGLFLCSFTAVSLARMGSELRCQCVSTHSQFIHPKHIQDVKLTQSGPHCKDVEIIATLKDGREVCLEPTAAWVKRIIKAILDKAEANAESLL
ncbi:hypothetical protein lerEdw1_017566 [Lerista edwardsae]|nr:hypothetical protein lerEdw1_017566 [Lerista edwardsae]